MPLVGTLELILRRPVRIIASIDAQTGIDTVKRGYSRKMAYLRKTQRVSISCLPEVFFGEAEDLEPSDERTTAAMLPGSDRAPKRPWECSGWRAAATTRGRTAARAGALPA